MRCGKTVAKHLLRFPGISNHSICDCRASAAVIVELAHSSLINMFKRPLSRALISPLSCLKHDMARINRPVSLAQVYRPGPLGARRMMYQTPISALRNHHHFVKFVTVAPQTQVKRYSTSPTGLFRTFGKWQRRISLISAFGGGILLTIFIGPILLVTIGGVAAVFFWRYWRQTRALRHIMDSATAENGVMQNPLANLSSLFSANTSQLASALHQQAVEKIKEDIESASSEISSYLSTDDPLSINFSDVLATSSSQSSAVFNGRHESKNTVDIEFSITAGGGPTGIARARGTVYGSQVNLEKVSIYWPQWDKQTILPASSNTSQYRGRIIEGEFRDVDK